jgi:hypothetical protein
VVKEQPDDNFDMKKVIEKELQQEKAQEQKADSEQAIDEEKSAKGENAASENQDASGNSSKLQMPRWPLKGEYLTQTVVYQDAFTAYLMTNSFGECLMARFSSTMVSGSRLIRGFAELQRILQENGASIKTKDVGLTQEEIEERIKLEKKRKEGTLTREEWDWLRTKEEKEDYENEASNVVERDIKHLVFVVHG